MPKKKSMESKIIDKIQDTSAFLWTLRVLILAIMFLGGGLMVKAKELTGYLAETKIKDCIKDSEEKQEQKIEKQFENLISLLVKSFPEVEKAAKEKLEKEKTNDVIRKAISN